MSSKGSGPGHRTGAEYDNACCGVFETADGQITEVREYLDTLHLAKVSFPQTLSEVGA